MSGPPVPVLLVEPSEVVLARWPDPALSLTDRERRRAEAFRNPGDRRDYLAAHLLVRECAAAVTGGRPEDVALEHHCPRCGSSEHGAPRLAGVEGLHVSLSRSRGVVAAAAGPTAVGVDVERAGGGLDLDDALLARALAPAEVNLVRRADDPAGAFLRLWVRKEALVKAGILEIDDLAGCDLSALPLHLEGGRARTRWGRWHVVDHRGDEAVASGVSLAPW